jgi:hypothetical protein
LTEYFCRRFTVPECKICQLRKDAVMPKCDKFTTSSNKITPYWYKEIDEVVMHHIKMLQRQNSLNIARDFDRLYVVLGSDTGELVDAAFQ